MNAPTLGQFLNAGEQEKVLLDVSVIGLATVGVLKGVLMVVDLVQIVNELLDPVCFNLNVPAFPVVA